MNVIHIGTLVWGVDPKPTTPEEAKTKHDGILAALNAPIYLGVANAVNYDMKANRYAAAFTPGEGKKLTLKTYPDVAAFVAEHIAKAGYWLGRMDQTDGGLTDAYLIQAD